MSRRLRTLAAATTATLALVLVGCNTGYTQGPAGKVTDRNSSESCHNTGTKHKRLSCSNRYELETQTSDGKRHEFAAPWSAFDHCFRGSTYPQCVGR